MQPGTIVVLKSFNLLDRAPKRIDPRENYWLLLGQRGQIVEVVPPQGVEADRVLVKFDCDVQMLGLHCHNHVENSLWIKLGDIEVL